MEDKKSQFELYNIISSSIKKSRVSLTGHSPRASKTSDEKQLDELCSYLSSLESTKAKLVARLIVEHNNLTNKVQLKVFGSGESKGKSKNDLPYSCTVKSSGSGEGTSSTVFSIRNLPPELINILLEYMKLDKDISKI